MIYVDLSREINYNNNKGEFMNKIDGLRKINELGLSVYPFILYQNGMTLESLNNDNKYLLRKSTKDNQGTVSLGVDRNLTYDELIEKINALKNDFNLIIQRELDIKYYGIVSRFCSSNMDYLAIELFDTLKSFISGVPCDRLEYHYIDNELIFRRSIPKENVIKYVMYDIVKINYREFQLEFVASNNDIYYTDFDIIERGKKYEKSLF